ncbi:hypothetical protein KI387_030166, partial [Taxus chinensis]
CMHIVIEHRTMYHRTKEIVTSFIYLINIIILETQPCKTGILNTSVFTHIPAKRRLPKLQVTTIYIVPTDIHDIGVILFPATPRVTLDMSGSFVWVGIIAKPKLFHDNLSLTLEIELDTCSMPFLKCKNYCFNQL